MEVGASQVSSTPVRQPQLSPLYPLSVILHDSSQLNPHVSITLAQFAIVLQFQDKQIQVRTTTIGDWDPEVAILIIITFINLANDSCIPKDLYTSE